MVEKNIDSMNDVALSPTDLITLMFERTNEDGILYTPAYNVYDEELRCHVDWNLEKYERLLDKFQKHLKNIEKIAAVYDEIDGSYENAKKLLGSELADFFNKYIRSFDIGDIDIEKVFDIDDRMETIDVVREIAERLANGSELADIDREFLSEYMNVSVSREEKEYHRKYVEARYNDAEKRIGKKLSAFELVIHSMRLCRLISLGAPKIIINHESYALVVAMLLYEYGISKDKVDGTVRLQIEKMELMSEEELDEMFRPKKSNTRKSMAPLFVYSILKEKSNSKKHLRQQDILKELIKYPYEISIERKALSRIIHNLTDSLKYAVYQDNTGVWIDQ